MRFAYLKAPSAVIQKMASPARSTMNFVKRSSSSARRRSVTSVHSANEPRNSPSGPASATAETCIHTWLPSLDLRRRSYVPGLPAAPAPDLLADGFRGRDSPEALGGRVEVQDDAVLADVDDRLGGVLDGVHGLPSLLDGASLLEAQLGALHGAACGRRQAREVVLEDVVHGAGGEGRHGRLFSDGAGDRDGGHVGGFRGEHGERLEAAEAGQVVVDQGEL